MATVEKRGRGYRITVAAASILDRFADGLTEPGKADDTAQ